MGFLVFVIYFKVGVNMEKKESNVEQLKKRIDEIDDAFSKLLDYKNRKYVEKEKKIMAANEECVPFFENIISNKIASLSTYKKNIDSIIQTIKDNGIDIPKTNENNAFFSCYEDALVLFEKASISFKDSLDDINSYSFSEPNSDFSFDCETAIINGKEYKAPNFPNLSENDFDDDNEYKDKMAKLFELYYSLSNCIEYLIKYYASNEYKEILQKKGNNVIKNFTDDLNQECEEKIRSYTDDFKKMYREECVPFLENNNRLLKDYITLKDFEMPVNFVNNINIGSIEYNFKNYDNYKNILSDIDIDKVINKKIKFPYYLDLMGKGNILINIKKDTEDLVDFVHQLVMQFISSVPYKKMNLALIDVDDFDKFDLVNSFSKEYLKKNKLLFSGKIITDGSGLDNITRSLCDKITEIKGEKLSPKNCKNVFEYNDISRENTQEMYLMVYVNCPNYLNEDIAKRISNLSINGNVCGIYSIIVNNLDYKFPKDTYNYNAEKHRKFIDRISSNSVVIDYSTDGKYRINEDVFKPNYAFKEENVNDFFIAVNSGCELAGSSQVIYLDSIIKEKYEKKPYYSQLKIPVGKDGGETVYFELDVEGANTSSAIVAGGTGSGKSSFLHSIILSGAYNYSPDELEYYLIDFKDGVEFKPYKDKEDGIYIPHVSFLSLKNKLEDAYDILKRIFDEKEYRNEYFKKVNAANLISYQSHPDVKSGKYPSFKRMIVIIDEYQNFLEARDISNRPLCDKCKSILLELLSQIRNVGISLVLSSQNISVEKSALDQINNRYIFSSSASVIEKAFSEFSGDSMNVELNKEKGLVYMTKDGGINRLLFKAAWSGKTNEKEQKSIVNEINKKWGNYQKDLMISGSEEALPIYKSRAPFVLNGDIKLSEDEIIYTTFGKSALSDSFVGIDFYDSDFCNYIIIGEMKKVRNIEASIGLSFLYSLKKYEFDLREKDLYYLDLNTKNDALRNPSPFDTYKDELEDVMNYCVETEEIVNSINDLYSVYESRKMDSKRRSRVIHSPKLLIINSFSLLNEFNETSLNEMKAISDDETDSNISNLINEGMGIESASLSGDSISLTDKVKELYLKGYSYSIYVVIQDRRINDINGYNSYNNTFDLSKVICCDKDELEKCVPIITISDLPQKYVVLYPNISKVRPFEFDRSEEERIFIKKLMEVLTYE